MKKTVVLGIANILLSDEGVGIHVLEQISAEWGDSDIEYIDGGKRSVHVVGLGDMMSIACLAGELSAERALIGIQSHKVDWCEELSAPVSAALPRCREYASELFRGWQL